MKKRIGKEDGELGKGAVLRVCDTLETNRIVGLHQREGNPRVNLLLSLCVRMTSVFVFSPTLFRQVNRRPSNIYS